jgi:hypothetical protein
MKLLSKTALAEDRRRERRQVINRIAKYQADAGTLPRDCMITDISKQGARLFADGVEVPDQFHLLISGENGTRRECQVVWRLGGEIGVKFIGPERRLSLR